MKIQNNEYNGKIFKHDNLEEAVFEGCTFIGCDFSHTKMHSSQFINCQFYDRDSEKGCLFRYADLRDASFKQCKLAMSDFSGANIFGAEFRDSDLKGANFFKASCANIITQRSFFCSLFITGCNLSYCNLQGMTIEKCDLFENKWSGANLVGASLQGSDLSRGVFSSDVWGDFNLQNCDLSHCELEGLDPRRVNLHGVKICDWQQEQLLEPFGIVVMPG